MIKTIEMEATVCDSKESQQSTLQDSNKSQQATLHDCNKSQQATLHNCNKSQQTTVHDCNKSDTTVRSLWYLHESERVTPSWWTDRIYPCPVWFAPRLNPVFQTFVSGKTNDKSWKCELIYVTKSRHDSTFQNIRREYPPKVGSGIQLVLVHVSN